MKKGCGTVAVVVALSMAGCGKSDPAPSSGGGGNGGGAGPTITITSAGVSPKTVTVARGTQVTFLNSDSRAHDMASDPHPTHENCPELAQVGTLNPGQSRQTGNLNTAGNCGFHDHNLPQTTSLQGTIVIQ